jgi:recombination protein U
MLQQKDPARQLQGKLNRSAGAFFEKYIEAACDLYSRKGLARVEKTPEPFKVTGKRMRKNALVFEGHFEKQAQPDFKGTLAGGKAIVFEAKSTQGDRIEQDTVTGEQTSALIEHSTLGALCFVYVALGFRDFYRVPWEVWLRMKELYGHKYMSREELEPYRLPEYNGYILIFDGVMSA